MANIVLMKCMITFFQIYAYLLMHLWFWWNDTNDNFVLIFQHICTFTPFRFLRLDVRALILLQFEFVQQNISNSFCNPDHSIVRADWDGFFQGEQERCRWHMPDQLVATATILYCYLFPPLCKSRLLLKSTLPTCMFPCTLNMPFSWILREVKGVEDWGLKERLAYKKGWINASRQ